MTGGSDADGAAGRAERLRQWLQRHLRDPRLVLYGLLPARYTDLVERYAGYARTRGYVEITGTLIYAALLLLVGGLVVLQLPLLYEAVIFVVFAPVSLLGPYLLFLMLAEKRRKSIERVLPDALLLMSANIESGLTVDKAFLLAARDEFGPLADDIRKTAMKMFGGTPVEEALDELAEDTNSELFEETLKLLVDGIESGSEVSGLLESSADDIRSTLELREEIASNVKTYSMFILIASVVGAPVLFSISVYLTQATTDLWGGLSLSQGDIPSTGTGLVAVSEPAISPAFFANFALAAIIISNLFAALVISEIKHGSVTNGLKRAPVFVVAAVIVYFIALSAVQSALGGFF